MIFHDLDCFSYEFEDEEFKLFLTITKRFAEGFGNGLPEDFFPIAKYIPFEKRKMFHEMKDEFMSVLTKQFIVHKERFIPGIFKYLNDTMH